MDNKRNSRSFDFDLADLPVVAHALSIECGCYLGIDRAKYRRVKELHDLVAEQVPGCSALFEAEDWQEFCRAISQGASYEVAHVRRAWGWSSEEGTGVVRIGKREWRSRRSDLLPDDETLNELRIFLEDYAPVAPTSSSSPSP